MSDVLFWVALVGLGLMTLLTRGGPLLLNRPLPLSARMRAVLQMAPMAALSAIIAPSVFVQEGILVFTLLDPRPWAILGGLLAWALGRGMLSILGAAALAYGVARWLLL